MSAHLTQPREPKRSESFVSPGLERERRNTDARATVAESRARVSRRDGDLRRAHLARQLADRAAWAAQLLAQA